MNVHRNVVCHGGISFHKTSFLLLSTRFRRTCEPGTALYYAGRDLELDLIMIDFVQ
jgi:hypothetical protein